MQQSPASEPPRYTVRVVMTKVVIGQAARRFWRLHIGRSGLLSLVAVLGVFLFALSRDQFWLVPVSGASLVLVPLIWLSGYLIYLRRAYRRFDRMKDKAIEFTFDEQGISVRSDLGSAQVPWRMLNRVWHDDTIWLLFVGRHDYVYLPAQVLDANVRAFLLEQARCQNARVR